LSSVEHRSEDALLFIKMACDGILLSIKQNHHASQEKISHLIMMDMEECVVSSFLRRKPCAERVGVVAV